MANQLKNRWREGGVVHGASCRYGSSLIVEQLAQSGLDYLYLDKQHGFIGDDTLVAHLQAMAGTGTESLVRVQSNNPGLIGFALDAGAGGVIIPMVNTREDAERAVAACQYGTDRLRSHGPLRLDAGFNRAPESVNDDIVCLVMIETVKGVENATEIAATPGVDGVYIGPGDLGISLGLAPKAGIQPGVHREAIETIRAACDAAGVVTGISGDPVSMAAEGFKMITIGSDFIFMQAGLNEALARRP